MVGVYCVVVAEVLLVADMTVMRVAAALALAEASGCWFVAVVPVSVLLIALAKSVLSAPSVIP